MISKSSKPILISTDRIEDSLGKLVFNEFSDKVAINKNPSIKDINKNGQFGAWYIAHIYIVSLDKYEKIEPGDYYFNNKDKSIHIAGENNIQQNEDCLKVTACTDDSLRSPFGGQPVINYPAKISPLYIKRFIKEYNNNEVQNIDINYIEVNDEETIASASGFSLKVPSNIKFRPNITNDGFIDIKSLDPRKDIENFKTKNEEGFVQSEIEQLLLNYPGINMEKFNGALNGITCMKIDNELVIYHCDVEKALLCGIEDRDLNIYEWD